ncbi:MAG: molybdopterin-guanine dinucleotide biosynthesis protein A [Alphaproteobacteria bacterium]
MALGSLAAGNAGAASDERHIGYYYPEPRSEEIYDARLPVLPDSDRRRRIGFVTVLTAEMLNRPYPPRIVVFAKGAQAEKLIITAVSDGSFNTLYRARALFAMMTAMARATPFFADQADSDRYTFFDLLKLLGFTQLTFTDGDSFAHRVVLR